MRTLPYILLLCTSALASSAKEIHYNIETNGPANEASSWEEDVIPSITDLVMLTSTRASQYIAIPVNESVQWHGISFNTVYYKDFMPEFTSSNGSTITLGAGGITTSAYNNKTTRFNTGLLLAADQTWTLSSGTFMFWNPIQLTGHNLTIAGAATKEIRNNMQGPGSLYATTYLKIFGGYDLNDIDLIANNPTTGYSGPQFVVSTEAHTRAKSITMRNGGQVSFSADTAATIGTQSISGDITQDGGFGKIIIDKRKNSKLLIQANGYTNLGGVTLFGGPELGCHVADSTDAIPNANLLFTTPPELAEDLIPGGLVSYSADVSRERGLGFATYSTTHGVSLFPEENYNTALSADTHVKLTNNGVGTQTNTLQAPLAINSLSLCTTNNPTCENPLPAGITIDGTGPLQIKSGMIWCDLSFPSPTADSAVWLNMDTLDFNGRNGYIYLRNTFGQSNGQCAAPVHLASDITNVGDQGVTMAGSGIIYLSGDRPLTYTGKYHIGTSTFLRMEKTIPDAIKGTFIIEGGTVQTYNQLDDDEADVRIHAGNLIIKSGKSNSGNAGWENFRDLYMDGGSFALAGGGGGGATIRSAYFGGGNANASRGTLLKVNEETIIAGGVVTLSSNTDKNRHGARLECVGPLTISNIADSVSTPLTMGYTRYGRTPGLILHQSLTMIGSKSALSPVTIKIDADTQNGTSAVVQLDGDIPFNITKNAMTSPDMIIQASIADAIPDHNTSGNPGRLVKTGNGTLELAATTNSLTGGISVQEGTLRIAGDVGSAIDVSSQGTLALAGHITVEGQVTFSAGATLTIEPNTSLTVTDSINATESISVTFQPPTDPDNQQLVLKSSMPIDANFITLPGMWKLTKRAEGKEVWLVASRGSLILIR